MAGEKPGMGEESVIDWKNPEEFIPYLAPDLVPLVEAAYYGEEEYTPEAYHFLTRVLTVARVMTRYASVTEPGDDTAHVDAVITTGSAGQAVSIEDMGFDRKDFVGKTTDWIPTDDQENPLRRVQSCAHLTVALLRGIQDGRLILTVY